MSLALLLPLLLVGVPPFAQTAAPPAAASADVPCATPRPSLPAGLEGWTTREPLAAGGSTRSAPVMVIGRAADLRLVPAERVTVTVPPPRPLEAGGTAGLALFQVAEAGRYRVALGTAAWIDVARAGRALPPVAYGHGPACTGIRKIVDFDLAPGRYVLQLSGTQAPTLPVMIVRARRGVA